MKEMNVFVLLCAILAVGLITGVSPSGTPTVICVMSSGHSVDNLAVYSDSEGRPYTTDGTGCASMSIPGSFIGQNFGMTVSVTFTYAGTGYVFSIPVAKTTTVIVP